MLFRVQPSTVIHPRVSFVAFVLVFFLPWLPLMDITQSAIVLCGVAYFLLGSALAGPGSQRPWPACRPRYALVVTILGFKAYALAHSLNFDFSVEAVASQLIVASIAQKENVALGALLNTVIVLVYWTCLLGMLQRGRLWLAIFSLVAYQVLSLQTGRFLLVSQVGLLMIIHHQIHGRRFNGLLLATLVTGLALSFPFLHAVRSGDINRDVEIYSTEYVRNIMAADASPGRNFLDLVEYIDRQGADHGQFVWLAPLQVVPRAVWPEKPVTSQQAHYTRAIYGLDHLQGVTFTFTIFDAYAWLGILGLAAACTIWGVLFMKLFHGFLGSGGLYLRLQLGFLTMNAFNFYRGNLLDFMAPVMLGLIVAVLLDVARHAGGQIVNPEHEVRRLPV